MGTRITEISWNYINDFVVIDTNPTNCHLNISVVSNISTPIKRNKSETGSLMLQISGYKDIKFVVYFIFFTIRSFIIRIVVYVSTT